MKFEVRRVKLEGERGKIPALTLAIGAVVMKSDLPDRTFAFAERIVRLCVVLESNGRVSGALANQLLRSGTSVGANVEEAQGAESKRDFAHKYSIACKEARETHYWLRLLAASGVVAEDRLTPLTAEANELVAILTSIVKKSKE